MKFLDIGCGSLRGGRHLIHYLNPYKYFGIDCNQSLVDLGRRKELGINFWKVRIPILSLMKILISVNFQRYLIWL